MALTVEERRERDRIRKRDARAAARKKREAETAEKADKADASAPSTMRDAVTAALTAMKWLMPSDDASVAQAKMLAEDVDLLRFAGETSKSLSAQRALTTVLNDLGGTPTVRLQRELRSLRLQRQTGDDEDGGESEGDEKQQPSNVSKFERPAKRSRTR